MVSRHRAARLSDTPSVVADVVGPNGRSAPGGAAGPNVMGLAGAGHPAPAERVGARCGRPYTQPTDRTDPRIGREGPGRAREGGGRKAEGGNRASASRNPAGCQS